MVALDRHRSGDELAAALDGIRQAPADAGTLELIVRRPRVDEREVLEQAELDLVDGLVGDDWINRGSRRSADGGPNPLAQLTVMGVRAVEAVAGDRERWSLAGDQLYVDLDLSVENLPAGTRLAIGETVIEVTEEPHTGCDKFSARFGSEAIKFVNKPPGRELRLRGLNAIVVTPGTVRVGDTVTKL